MTYRALAAALAAATALALAACGSDDDSSSTDAASSDSVTSSDGDVGQIGTPIEKQDATLTITNLTVGGECKYGQLGDQELAEGGKILQTEGTFANNGTEGRNLLGPVPLNADGTETVVPESIEYSTPCNRTDSEDGTVDWYEAGEAGSTRDVYNVQVIPAESTAVNIAGKVFQLPTE